jgi:iron complex outermembrane receptor protein
MFTELPIARVLRLAFGGSIAGIALVVYPAYAQTGATGTPVGSDVVVQQGERVEVTGSSIKRIDAESGSPLQVISREDIQHLAPQNTEELLRSISATNSVGNLVTATGAGATTGGVSTVSLRGLGANRTLILVNGRRVSAFGGLAGGGAVSSVDVNSIPVAAIERVEVLKDGASAIYGSDAIAGVINFILRSDYSGVLAEVQYGQTTHSGDGESYTGDVVLGYGDLQKDKFNVMLTASYSKDAAIYGSQRRYAANGYQLDGTGTDTNDYTSSNTYPANIVTAGGASYRNFLAPGYAAGVASGLYPTFGGTEGCAPSITTQYYGTLRCRYDPSPLVPLIPDQRRTNVGFNGQYAITPDMTAYLELSGSRVITKYSEQASPVSDAVGALNPTNPYYPTQVATLTGPTGAAIDAGYGAGFAAGAIGTPAFFLPTTSPYYPTAFATALGLNGSPLDLRYRTVEAGGRQIRDESTSGRFVTGLKGTAYNWDYDAGVLYAQSRLKEYDVGGYELYSELLPLLNSGVINPFGPSTPAAQQLLANTIYHGEAYDTKTQFTSFNGHASRDVYNLPAGPISVAVGGDFRHESYNFNASTAYQTGDITGYGGNGIGIDKSRNVEAGFLELNVPIIKGLDADLAGRYDNYENVGNTFNPKASLRWQPVKQFLARASIGTGFRAPALDELYAPVTTGVSAEFSDPLRCPANPGGPDCNKQFNVQNGGNAALQPEKSTSLTYGFQIEPTENVHFGVDYFDIKLRDTIVIGGVNIANILDSAADAQKYGYLVTRAPAGADGLPGAITSISQQNLNLYKQHVRGLDFDFKLRVPAPYGRLTAALNGTYFLTDDQQNADGSYTGVVANANVFSGSVLPRWKHIASLTYDYGPYSGTFIQNYQSAYADYPGDISGADRRVGPYETFDIQASYTGLKHVKMTLGVKNIMDRDPPYSNVGGGFYFQSGYDPSYADVHGRFIYARLGYEFK